MVRVKQSHIDSFRLKHKFAGSFVKESLVKKKIEKKKTVKKKELQLCVTFSEFAEAIWLLQITPTTTADFFRSCL